MGNVCGGPRNEYDPQQSIRESKFLKEVETGDILLFNTRNIGSKFVRTATNSNVDHIALCVFIKTKHSDDQELCLLEAVDRGV